jgi:hypothetical protein
MHALPPASLPVTELDLCAWIGQAAPGDSLQYFRGHLAMDRDLESGRLTEAQKRELAAVARRAWHASEHGLVHLLQRRHGEHDYGYIAVLRQRPANGSESLSALLLQEAA